MNLAFKYGDEVALEPVRANLNCAIRLAKWAHSQRIQDSFHNTTNSRNMWEGIRAITNYFLNTLKMPSPLLIT